MKKHLKPVIVLTAICLCGALLLAVVNLFTKPIIEENLARRQRQSLLAAMPGAADFTQVNLPADAPDTVRALYRETGGGGYVMLLSARSQYTGSEPMGITVGIDGEGKITGVVLTSYTESKDFGKSTYPARYTGLGTADAAAVETVSGVTYSSTAFRKAIADAFCVWEQVSSKEARA